MLFFLTLLLFLPPPSPPPPPPFFTGPFSSIFPQPEGVVWLPVQRPNCHIRNNLVSTVTLPSSCEGTTKKKKKKKAWSVGRQADGMGCMPRMTWLDPMRVRRGHTVPGDMKQCITAPPLHALCASSLVTGPGCITELHTNVDYIQIWIAYRCGLNTDADYLQKRTAYICGLICWLSANVDYKQKRVLYKLYSEFNSR